MNRREIIIQGSLALTVIALPFPISTFKKNNSMIYSNNFDVIVIGGNYAGLSAAMALGRSLRTVLIIDGGEPCNRFTPHSHNFITHDGEKPSEITKKAKEDVLKYDTVTFIKDFAISGKKTEKGFKITTQSHKDFSAKKIIFATGIKDIIPNIKGFVDCWGKTIIHCPYCHGYEFKNKKTAIFANGPKGFHLASMVNNLTNNLTLLTNSKHDFNEQQLHKLKKYNIEIIETAISEIEHNNGKVNHVIFSDGTKKSFEAIYASLSFRQHSDIPVFLGCEITEHGYLKVNTMQETNINGVYACGDNSSIMRSVSYAVATGGIAGAIVNGKLVEEHF